MNNPHQGPDPNPPVGSTTPAATMKEVRYSLKELVDAVASERRVSALGRELVDVHEIDKMFSKAIRRKQQ